jgi:hypothetical protein
MLTVAETEMVPRTRRKKPAQMHSAKFVEHNIHKLKFVLNFSIILAH